jgi:energy-coupling factor transporter ATP-binding protein EcfA2
MDRFVADARGRLADLERLRLPRLFQGHRLFWLFIAVWLAIVYPVAAISNWVIGIVSGGAGALAAVLGLWIGLFGRARSSVRDRLAPLRECAADGAATARTLRETAQNGLRNQLETLAQQRDHALRQADETRRRRTEEIRRRRDDDLLAIDDKYTRRLADTKDRHDDRRQRADRKYSALLADIQARFERESRQAREQYETVVHNLEQVYRDNWDGLAHRWRTRVERIQGDLAELQSEDKRLFPDWSAIADDGWSAPKRIPPALRFGQLAVDVSRIPHGIPADERLRTNLPSRFAIPAVVGFPRTCSVLLMARGAGLAAAEEVTQTLMLRYLTSLPPGKARFTIVDPVGLGKSFAPFMHLADYDELLVNYRIWTEPPQIDQKLADLTEHIENVIQKYLRSEFETIEAYNEQAGQIAEPYRILVVANFPTNFTENSARRLLSVFQSGPRCGVYALVTVDAQQRLPTSCLLDDFQRHAVVVEWQDGRFVWQTGQFARWPLTPDAPPPQDRFLAIMNVVGELAKDANRVEVPFEVITPPQDQWWTSASREGIRVPLGPCGATKLQCLDLGRGTSQHVLIAGKTGSGKSSLLHALITNLALNYSPDEVEVYLIDFKKGVEFKKYATHTLAHARVVAIESEREFGLSVMQRLDAELRYRGESFRAVGVQDIETYRNSAPDRPMPRILLIVDEFQEFFVEDDKVAQEASLLLDRLVRQGRAFGIHVILGSQTLAGAYSLARSTVGQMAVRIALQCSDADAHLILSEENSAARLLTRPGEAIYNDANGLVEGNQPFQVAWISESDRDKYLERVYQLESLRGYRRRAPQVVFEGSAPAEVGGNHLLGDLLSASDWPQQLTAFKAWLGEPVAITEPTHVVVRPQSGANVLVIGQNETAARATLTTAVISLAAQHPPSSTETSTPAARFYIFDGTSADDPHTGYFERVAESLPHTVGVVRRRDVGAAIAEIAAQVESRTQSGEPAEHNIYLVVYDLQRFRELRKKEDDFGFSRSDDEQGPAPDKQFAAVLRDGPPVGVHTIIWCDSVTNLGRTLDRASAKEFEMRVLFQMSANDSSSLIDSPAAGRLGPYRAYLYSEEEERLDKFRPYAIPSAEWLAHVRQCFESRRCRANPTG